MKLAQRWIVLGGLILTLGGMASESFAQQKGKQTKGQEKKAPTTKELMGEFLLHMDALKVYFTSEEKFTDAKNQAAISRHLKELSRVAKKASHDPVLAQENYKISMNVLTNHLSETQRVFEMGSKPYARWMLNSTMSVCLSCHAQLPTASRDLKDFENQKSYASNFDQAEFLFTTRAFDKASNIFDDLIKNYPKESKDVSQLEIALQRQVAYYSRVQRDPKNAIKTFTVYTKNKEIPEYIQKDIKSWVSQFKEWQKSPALDPKKANDDQILKLAESNLPTREPYAATAVEGSRSVNHLRVSGLLYEYLHTHPQTKIVPELLYYLAVYDRTINNNFFYSLANLYLRECIVSHPSHPFAEKCYYEFEAETILSYSGSSGTHVPKDVRQDLNELKKLVESKGEIQKSKSRN